MRFGVDAIDHPVSPSDISERRDWSRIPPRQRQTSFQTNKPYITFTRIAHRGGSKSLGTRKCRGIFETSLLYLSGRIDLTSLSARISESSSTKFTLPC